jgi:DNA-directed RNA polymerase subunit RPC12/RpoP
MRSQQLRCAECGTRFELDDDLADRRRVPCPRCGEMVSTRRVRRDDDDYRPRRAKQGGGKTLLFVLLGVGGLVLILAIGGIVLAVRAFGPEDSRSPVPLPQARAGFQTKLIPNSFKADGPPPIPPADQYRLVRYASPAGPLAAYLTPDPRDGRKHPAVVWAHGGFGGFGSGHFDMDEGPELFRQAGTGGDGPFLARRMR